MNTGMTYDYAYDLAIGQLNPLTIYVAAANDVYRSTTGGDSWLGSTSGLTQSIMKVAASPQNPNTIYCLGGVVNGYYQILLKSKDGGLVWRDITASLANVRTAHGFGLRPLTRLAVDPTDANTVYVGTLSGEVYKSVTGGESW